jgi:outer membrane protein
MQVVSPSCLARNRLGRGRAMSGKIPALALCALAVGSPAWAGTDLLQAWHAAQSHDPSYASASAERQAGEARRRQGRALLRPQVVASASGGLANDDRNTTGAQFIAPGFGNSNDVGFHTHISGGNETNWTVALQQPIYNAERFAGVREFDAQADLAESRFGLEQQQLMLATARAYFEVLIADESLRTIRAQKESVEEALAATRALFEEGKLPVTDSAEAEARFDEISATEIYAASELELKQAAFTDRTGLPTSALMAVGSDARLEELEPGPLESWLDRARTNSLELQVQRLNRDIARTQTDKFKGSLAPTLDLVARVSDDRLSGDSGWGASSLSYRSQYVGLQLTLPVFTGGMRGAKYSESVALASKADADVDETGLRVVRETRAAWLSVSSGLAQYRASRKALQSAQTRLDATQVGYDVGARTTLDLLNAKSDMFRARLALAQSRHRVVLSRLELAAAAGELSEEELKRVDRLLALP